MRGPADLRSELVSRTVLVLLGVVALGGLGFWLSHLNAEYALEIVEIHVLTLVRWWQAGHLPYAAADSLPLLQNPYGPLYEALCAVLPGNGYLTGRVVSMAALLAALALIGVVVHRTSRSLRLALLCALLPLTAKPIVLFAPLYRVDTLGACLSLAGFLCLRRSQRARGDALGAALCLLAFLTKLTFIAAPLACLLARLPEDRRGALRLALLLVPLPLSVLVLEALTGGHYLASAAMGNLPSHLGKGLGMAVRPGVSLLWLVAVVAAWSETRRETGSRRPSATTLYVLVCLVTATIFATNPLSSWNYLIEFYLALALWSGEALARARPRPLLRRALLAHALLALPLTASWVGRVAREASEHAAQVEVARACLADLIRPGDRAAVFASTAGRDAVNSLGALNALHVPRSIEEQPATVERLRSALERGELEHVIEPADLVACTLE